MTDDQIECGDMANIVYSHGNRPPEISTMLITHFNLIFGYMNDCGFGVGISCAAGPPFSRTFAIRFLRLPHQINKFYLGHAY